MAKDAKEVKKPEGFNKDIMIFGGFFLGIIFLWLLSGGMNQETARSGVFIKAPSPVDSGATYGGKPLLAKDTEKESLSIPKTFDFSFLKNWAIGVKTKPLNTSDSRTDDPLPIIGPLTKDLVIDGIAGARESDPNSEYLRIAPNPTPTHLGPWNVSGLILKSEVTGKQETIPEATLLPILGEVPELIKVAIGPKEAVILTTGESPIGTSFKTNMCSGYLGQFQDYTPLLRNECPSAIEEIDAAGLGEDTSCVEFSKTMPRCRAFIGTVPKKLSTECKAFITRDLTYNKCVTKHKDNADFYKDEWRIFLGRNTEMWKNKNEIIKIIDRNGDVVDAVTY
jgi:hypothetical protein